MDKESFDEAIKLLIKESFISRNSDKIRVIQ